MLCDYTIEIRYMQLNGSRNIDLGNIFIVSSDEHPLMLQLVIPLLIDIIIQMPQIVTLCIECIIDG